MSDLSKCLHPKCSELKPTEQYACRAHWFSLPKGIRDRVWAGYRAGGTRWVAAHNEAQSFWSTPALPKDVAKSLMTCRYCNKDAEMVTGKTLYPTLLNLHGKFFYRCRPCDAHVGCHPGTNRPLGSMANAPLRKLRMRAHNHFDKMWRSGQMKRSEAYAWLAEQLRIPVSDTHIGMFEAEQCEKVILICK